MNRKDRARRWLYPYWILSTLFTLLASPYAFAAVDHVEAIDRKPYEGGRVFPGTGAYEVIRGRAWFKLDPDNKANLRIVDLRLAPRDASGLVEFSTDFVLVRPVRAVESTWLYDIANRGGGVTEGLNYVIDPAKNPPSIDTGFLQRNGFTVLTSAWEWDVTPEEGDASALVFKPPVASNHGHRITGKWRTNLPWRSLAIPPPSWALMGAHIPWLWPMIRQAY